MDGRSELLAYLGSALATIVVLFGAQHWYASYLDVAVVHGQSADAPMDAKLAAVRAEEQRKLTSGSRPIAGTKQALAQRGRTAFPRITPKASEDLGAMSGWINKPGFAAYVPRQPQTPAAAHADATATAEGGATAPAAAAPAPAAPAPGKALP